VRHIAVVLFANLLLFAQAPTGPAQLVPALSPYIDVHAHPETDPSGASIEAARQALGIENAVKIFFLPPPFTADDSARFDSEAIATAVAKFPGTFQFLGGGGTLNPMIQAAMRSGDVSSEARRNFSDRAEAILRQGAVGFGEMAAEHFAGATPYQYAPADHPLFLLLADIAAQHGVPIDLHMEAVPQAMRLPSDLRSPPNPTDLHANIAPFERLLSHNPATNIVWAHAGSDGTGYRTPDLCRRLLRAHANLYMQIKLDPANPGKNYPLDPVSGRIRPEWLRLLQEFQDRFVMGTDQHYPMPGSGIQRWQASVFLLNQLPAEIRQKIGARNAQRLYRQ
jgi:predicted TIM-barrel fold metal-dependent hydrolase